jgi:hypothetical protein
MNIAPAGMSRKQPTRRGRTWRFAAIVGLVLTIPVENYLGLWLEASYRLGRERKKVVAELSALRAERVYRPSLFEPEVEGNSWDLLKTALPFWKNSHIDPDRKLFYPDQQGRLRGDPQNLDRVLLILQPRFDEIRQALRCRFVDPGHDYSTAAVVVPHLLEANSAFSVLVGAASQLQSEGRHKEALDSLLICLGLADHLRVKGYAISVAIAISGDNLGFDRLKRLLASHHLESAELARLARALEILESSWLGPLEYYRGEYLHERHAAIALADGGPDADELRRWSPEIVPGWRQLYSDRILSRRLCESFDNHLAWVKAVTRLPVSAWADALETASLRTKESGDTLEAPYGNWNWYLKEWCVFRMRLTLARVSVALARYQAENGEYPARLEALSPRYLPEIPVDPYGGQPLGYLVKHDKVTIISRTRDPEYRNRPVGAMLGPEGDGFPAWGVRRK